MLYLQRLINLKKMKRKVDKDFNILFPFVALCFKPVGHN